MPLLSHMHNHYSEADAPLTNQNLLIGNKCTVYTFLRMEYIHTSMRFFWKIFVTGESTIVCFVQRLSSLNHRAFCASSHMRYTSLQGALFKYNTLRFQLQFDGIAITITFFTRLRDFPRLFSLFFFWLQMSRSFAPFASLSVFASQVLKPSKALTC